MLNRRQLLGCGTLGSVGLAQLLRHEAAAPRSSRPRSVILIQHYGAPSHIDLWDPKPDAPDEIRGEFGTIATSLPGYRVSELPRGEYDFLAGYGGSVHGEKCLASNLVAFDVRENGIGVLVMAKRR